jgi:hypothetical protein
MATYVLPDDRLNQEQRHRYFYEMTPDDAVEITAHVLEHFPAAFDDAVENTGRVHVLAGIHAKQGETRA